MKRLAFFLATLCLAGPVLASDTAAVSATINAFFSNAGGLASKNLFGEDGTTLMHLLALILIAWTGIFAVFSDGGFLEAMAKLIRLILIYAICSIFLQQPVQERLVKGFDYFAAKAASATGAPVDMSDPAKGVATVMSAGFETALNLWRPVSAEESQDKRGWLQTLASEGVLQLLLYSFEEGLIKIAITGLILITLAIYCFVIASSLVLTQIGLTVAPLFVPWLLWDATAFLFNSWLRFMVTAGVVKLVAALNLGMTWGLLEGVKKLANSANSTAAFDYFAYFTALFLTLLMGFLMLQTYSIASGLVSGLPSVGMPQLPRFGGGNKSGNSGAPKPPAPGA